MSMFASLYATIMKHIYLKMLLQQGFEVSLRFLTLVYEAITSFLWALKECHPIYLTNIAGVASLPSEDFFIKNL